MIYFCTNAEFTYHEFVLKKVFDDDPLTKILMIYTIVLMLMSFLVHVVESVHGACYWKPGVFVGTDGVGAQNLGCSSLAVHDAYWFTVTTFLSIGYVKKCLCLVKLCYRY